MIRRGGPNGQPRFTHVAAKSRSGFRGRLWSRSPVAAIAVLGASLAVVNVHPQVVGLGSSDASANPLQMATGLPYADPPAAAFTETADPAAPGGVVRNFKLRSSNGGTAGGMKAVDIGGLTTGAVKVLNASNSNPNFTGPTMRMRRGTRTTIDFTNDMNESTIVHFHGSHVAPGFVTDGIVNADNQQDNVFVTIEPGKTRHIVLDLPLSQPLGTIWYHTHMHDTFFANPGVVPTDTQFPAPNLGAKPESSQMFKGFAGVIEVDDQNGTPLHKSLPAVPAAVANAVERTLELKEFQLAAAPGSPTGAKLLDPGDPAYLPSPPNCVAPVITPGTNCITRTVNGQFRPVLAMTAGKPEVWHLANTSANAWFDVQGVFSSPVPSTFAVSFNVLAQDGNPRWTVTTESHLLMPPGRRFDVLVSAPMPGTYTLRTAQVAMGSNARWTAGPAGSGYVGDLFAADDLATIKVGFALALPYSPVTSATAVSHLPAPTGPARALIFDEEFDPALPPAFRLRAPGPCVGAAACASVATKPVAGVPLMVPLESRKTPAVVPAPDPFTGQRPYFMDDYPGSPGAAKLGTTEEWTLYNYTPEDHPFHIHTNAFELLAVNGVGVVANGLSDTEVVPHATMSTTTSKAVVTPGTIKIRIRFSDFVGDLMMHCHISEHLDGGMITTLRVNP